MKNFICIALAMTLSLHIWAQSEQNDIIRCYTMEDDAQRRANNAELGSLEDFENWLRPLVRQYEETGASNYRAVQTLPIVFHVIYSSTSENLNAAYINAQIDQLNQDFGKYGDGANSHPAGADSELEFCAATVEPNGNAMSEPGINRISSSSAGFGNSPFSQSFINGTIKPNTIWDPTQYCNVWVMGLSGGLLGYAQFPEAPTLPGIGTGNGGSSTDGVVVANGSIGSVALPNPQNSNFARGRTLTHELGHWLGLRHIWGDGGCSVDDYVNDTPTSDAANYGCPNTVSCGTTDMVENYMDYSNDVCMNIFTEGQKTRMKIVMSSSSRRASLANSNKCGSAPGGGGEDCNSTVSSFPYNAGFENTLDGWEQATNDDINWSVNSAGTPSNNTGPGSATEGSYYLYVEASGSNYPSKSAIISSPCLELPGGTGHELTFQYHMYGASNMGDLALQIRLDGTSSWSTIWSLSGNQGNSWESAAIDLSFYATQTIQLRFNGTTGATWQGDMAIDDLSITVNGTPGGGGDPCTGGISSFPYAEGFENGLGSWGQGSGDDFNWASRSGRTPSNNTGPSSANEGSVYMYVESSNPNYPTKVAILNGPCFDLSGETVATFTFDYHMYGSTNMGGLQFQASTNDGDSWNTVWALSGNQGNSWQSANVDLGAYVGASVSVRFVGTTGSTWAGDMAIDKVGLNNRNGGGPGDDCVDITFTINLDNYPEETSWEILDQNTGVVEFAGGTYGNQADGSTINLTGCLEAKCYTLVMYDSYGDGICCGYGLGSYSFTVDGTNQVVASGGSFGSLDITDFLSDYYWKIKKFFVSYDYIYQRCYR